MAKPSREYIYGVNPTFDGTRVRIDGDSSYHFGLGNVSGAPRSYDFPGGAQGSRVSNEFSLAG